MGPRARRGAKETARLCQRHCWAHHQKSHVGDAGYLTVSMCLCDGQLRRGGAGASTLYSVEELSGGVVFSIGCEAVCPQDEQAQFHLNIDPSQALVWQARFYILFP